MWNCPKRGCSFLRATVIRQFEKYGFGKFAVLRVSDVFTHLLFCII